MSQDMMPSGITFIFICFFVFQVKCCHCFIVSNGQEKHCPSDHVSVSIDNIALSTVECSGMTPERRRCRFSNVFISHGVIWIVSDRPLDPPRVLCSAVTNTPQYAKYCQLRVASRSAVLDILLSLATPSGSVCVREMDVALAFGRLARANCYHSLFEDFIPIFETLTLFSDLFSYWLKTDGGGQHQHQHVQQRDMILFVEDESPDFDSNSFSFRFWGRFFPSVLLVDKYTTAPSEVFKVKHLVAGSNSSCVHYFHCSRGAYSSPGAAMAARQFVLAKVGISLDEQGRCDQFVGEEVAPKVITIIQRQPTESRQLLNIEKILSICNSVFSVGVHPHPCVVKRYSELSLDRQVRQTYSSDILLGVHGGALGNLLFAKNRSTLIDVYPYSFPYSFHGLVNWVRFSLSDSLFIGHAPFEITQAEDMFFRLPGNSTASASALSPCLCNTSSRLLWFKCGFGKMLYRSAGMTLSPQQLSAHLSLTLDVWKLRQALPHVSPEVDPPPVTRDDFKAFSLSITEPWYYPFLRSGINPLGYGPPSLHSLPLSTAKRPLAKKSGPMKSVNISSATVPLPDCSAHFFFSPRRNRKRAHKHSAGTLRQKSQENKG